MVLALFPSGRVPCSGLPRAQCLGAPERCAWNGDACKEHAPRPERPMRALEREMITCESIEDKRFCKDEYEDCDWDKDDKTCSTVCAAVDGKSRCERAPRCVWEAWDGDEEAAGSSWLLHVLLAPASLAQAPCEAFASLAPSNITANCFYEPGR